jgi:WD40 repeat protein
MTYLATRRKRRRRIAVAAGFAILLAVLAVVGTLWRRSVLETRRAEAAKLLALAQVQLEKDPTEALVYTTASLELADTHEGRVFAVRALWAGPPVTAADLRGGSEGEFWEPVFSSDGHWLAISGIVNENVLVYHESGGQPIVLGGHVVSASGPTQCAWTSDNLLVTGHNSETRVRVWSMPAGSLVRTIEFGEPAWWQVGEHHLFVAFGLRSPPQTDEPWPLNFLRWKLPDGDADGLGSVDVRAVGAYRMLFEPGGAAWLYSKGNGVYARPLPITAGTSEVLLGTHSSDGIGLGVCATLNGLYSCDRSGEVMLWAMNGGSWAPGTRLRPPEGVSERLVPGPDGRWATRTGFPGASIRLWDLEALRHAEAIQFRRNNANYPARSFHPHGNWLAGVDKDGAEMTLWPLGEPLPVVVRGWLGHRFTRDGRYLVATDFRDDHPETMVSLWPVPGNHQDEVVDLMLPRGSGAVMHQVSADPMGRHVLALNYGRSSYLLSVSGEGPRNLFGFPASDRLLAGDFSPSGRLVAAASVQSEGRATLRVWDLGTDHVRIFDQPEDLEAWKGYAVSSLFFTDETTLLTAGANGLLLWNVETGAHEVLRTAPSGGMVEMAMAADRRRMLTWQIGGWFRRIRGSVRLHEQATQQPKSLEIPGEGNLGLSPDGDIWVSSEPDGSILVGRIDGGEPHLLLGHDGLIYPAATVSPDGLWIASSGAEGTLRLWPMPDLSKPPLHTLPHEELIAKLKGLTNLRAVRDPESSTGWKIEVGPFPGWAEVPEW